jgi:pyruvate kinase
VMTMRRICAEAESYLASERRTSGDPAPLSEFIDSITGASVDAACLMAEQLHAALVMVASDSGRTALALSNRRPAATILALTRNDQVARSLSLCWGVTPAVFPDATWAEHELTIGMNWARSHGLAQSGEHAVLLRGQVADRSDIRAVLAGTIT